MKICFVIMGFGEKMDYDSSEKVNLDEMYLKVIKKVFSENITEYKLVRADEIMTSSIIDVEMYTLLINADLVIADITTLNPNAIYELGVRHALKPYTTVIIRRKSDKSLPFDISHNRVFTYEKQGYEFTDEEIKNNIEVLRKVVIESEKSVVDSPLYTYLKVNPPTLLESSVEDILSDAKKKEKNIAKLVSNAQNCMHKSDFSKSKEFWKELIEILPDNDYVVQQYALSTYKSKQPDEHSALVKAQEILSVLNPENSLDTETIGISGAICKRLFYLDSKFDTLDKAISFYQKGYLIKKDYYNGENYANCLLMKIRKKELSKEEINYIAYDHLRIRRELINTIEHQKKYEDDFWALSTLSLAYFSLEDECNFQKYKDLFMRHSDSEWQRDTFKSTLENLEKDLSFLKEKLND